MDDSFDSTVVINMEKDVQRWEDLQLHLKTWGLVAERFSPLPSPSLPFVPTSMQPHYLQSLNLTHAAICRRFLLESKKSYLLVLEDDCRFLVDPCKIIPLLLKALQGHDWSIVSLGCFSYEQNAPKTPLPKSHSEIQLDQPQTWFPWGTHAYIVQKKWLPDLIGSWSAMLMPPDHVLIHEYRKRRGFLVRPSIAYQEEYSSYVSGATRRDTISSADLHLETISRIRCAKSSVVQT